MSQLVVMTAEGNTTYVVGEESGTAPVYDELVHWVRPEGNLEGAYWLGFFDGVALPDTTYVYTTHFELPEDAYNIHTVFYAACDNGGVFKINGVTVLNNPENVDPPWPFSFIAEGESSLSELVTGGDNVITCEIYNGVGIYNPSGVVFRVVIEYDIETPPPPPPGPPEPLVPGEGVIGWVREGSWAVTPVSGDHPNKTISGILFFSAKEEGLNSEITAEPQADDMSGTREVAHVIENALANRGRLRFIPGPETAGFLFTQFFGTPTTTPLAASSSGYDPVYQHVWYPGLNEPAMWPPFYSIESQYAGLRSKLAQGAVIYRLSLEMPQNGVMTAVPWYRCKRLVWLYPDSDDAHGSNTLDDRGNTRPAIMTPNPVVIREDEWHFRQIRAYPQMESGDEKMILDVRLNFEWSQLRGIYTGGSGIEIGTYAIDNLLVGGRLTMPFEDETWWERFMQGQSFRLDVDIDGAVIQGDYRNSLSFSFYLCKATALRMPQRVGGLDYDFSFVAAQDPAQSPPKSCQITLVNTVSTYAT